MTHEQKIDYMKIAAGIVGYSFDKKNLDMLVSLYDLTLEKKGETDLDSIVQVKLDVDRRAEEALKQETLDKFSKKKK